jgi:Tol biopolymer transport system component
MSQENVEVVRRSYQAFNENDLAGRMNFGTRRSSGTAALAAIALTRSDFAGGKQECPPTRIAAVVVSTVLFMSAALARPVEATFPGKNGKLAFVGTEQEHVPGYDFRDIFSINLDGTGLTNLTNNRADNGRTPFRWSPDGKTLAFNSDGDGRDNYYNRSVYRVDADGSHLIRLTRGPSFDPEWSPGGSKIAFVSEQDDYPITTGGGIYTMNADGSDLRRLTYVGGFGLAWSPDGKKIAFERDGIYTINADGTGETRLTYGSYEDRSPSWSPDSRKIGFTTNRESGCQSVIDGCFAAYAMNADGSGQARLTENRATNAAPVWSPDGSSIAFLSFRDGNYELYAMNADGSGEMRLTHNGSGAFVWSPDGRYLATSEGDAIAIVNRDGSGERRLLTGGNGGRPDWPPIPEPKRSDYKNAAQFCKAERDFLGDAAFAKKYGTNQNGANAYGECVSQTH